MVHLAEDVPAQHMLYAKAMLAMLALFAPQVSAFASTPVTECPEATEECVDEFLTSNVKEMAEKNKVLCTPLHHPPLHQTPLHQTPLRPPIRSALRSRVRRSSTS